MGIKHLNKFLKEECKDSIKFISLSELSGKKIGVIGVGNIGKEVISLLKPFGCEILVNDIIDLSLFESFIFL